NCLRSTNQPASAQREQSEFPSTLRPPPSALSQPVRRNPSIQRTSRQSKRLSGAADVAFVATQRFLDEQTLHFFEREIFEAGGAGAGAAEGQVVGADVLALREQPRALHGVIELADVPGPRVLEEMLHGAGVESRQRLAIARRVAAEEVHRERRNVLASFAKRR